MFASIWDFFNSREEALVICAASIFAFAAWKGDGVIRSLGSVVRAAFAPKLLLLWTSAAVYVGGVVYLALRLGVWRTDVLKETLFWFFGSALVCASIAVGSASEADPQPFRKLLRRTLTFTIVLEFFANLYVLPLWAELPIVALAILVGMMRAVADHANEIDDLTKRVLDALLILLGVPLFLYSVVHAAVDLNGFLTRENAEKLLVGPALSVALVPFLYAAARLSRREMENLRRRFGIHPINEDELREALAADLDEAA